MIRRSGPGRAGPTGEQGSTIPLILGFFLISLLVVAGSVAAGDAFVQQGNLQSLCDGAAVAAASSADLDRSRIDGRAAQVGYLNLSNVQNAADEYLSRDPARSTVRLAAALNVDATTVDVSCTQALPVAFGSMFGFSTGLVHHANSRARAPLRVG